MKCIVYTRPDGGVSIIHPAPACMMALCNGGRPLLENYEIDKMVRNGRDPDLARRWIRALNRGGCTSAEAYALIRDKDMTAGGMAPELWDEVPADRWFRNAWTRAPEGGPIFIDLDKSKAIQASTIYFTYKAVAKRARIENDLALLAGRNYFEEIPELDMPEWRRRIAAASTVAEVRSVWPSWLGFVSSPVVWRGGRA